jgi:hypothetical protein
VALPLALLGACVESRETPVSYASYVDSLRAENNLAHASLSVPPLGTLSGFAAVAVANSTLGEAVPAGSAAEIAALIGRSSLSANEVTYWACRIAEATEQSIAELLPGVEVADGTMPTKAQMQDASQLYSGVFYALASKCLGNAVDVSELTAAVGDYSSLEPTLSLLAERVGVPISPDQFMGEPAVLTELEARVSQSGCDEWALADAAAFAHFRVPLPEAVENCLGRDNISLSLPQNLDFLTLAGWDTRRLEELMATNEKVLRRWVSVADSYASDWDEPVGLGTIANTRDATQLLWVSKDESDSFPQWMREGIAGVLADMESGSLEVTDDEAADLLVLCKVYGLATCPDGLEDRVVAYARSTVVSMSDDPPTDDAAASRLVDTLVWISSDAAPSCVASEFREWMSIAPLTAMSIAAGDVTCYEEQVGADEANAMVLSRLAQGDPEGAIAWAMLRYLLDPPAQDVEYRQQARQAWDDMVADARQVVGADAIDKDRPLSLELMHALFESWIG